MSEGCVRTTLWGGWGSAPCIAVGACQSVTSVEQKLHWCSTVMRSTESDGFTIFTVGCKSWYAISHPSKYTLQYQPKPIKVSKPWVIHSSFIKQDKFETSVTICIWRYHFEKSKLLERKIFKIWQSWTYPWDKAKAAEWAEIIGGPCPERLFTADG